MSEPKMSRSRCNELLRECRDDLELARQIGDKPAIDTQRARLRKLESIILRYPSPVADVPQMVEAA